MASGVYEILELFRHLSLDEKKNVMKDLQSMIEEQESEPDKSFLEEQWTAIENLIYDLSREPYIDDQLEIDEIWDICATLIKSGKLKKETWETRKHIMKLIIENEYYDYYGVCDPMQDLLHALILTSDEGIWCAECMETCSKYMKKEAAKIYRHYGMEDRYFAYLENSLERASKPYAELAAYYSTRDEEKAIEIAELGRKRCNDRDLTSLYIFLIKVYKNKKDEEYLQKLLKSAKARRMVDLQAVLKAYEDI